MRITYDQEVDALSIVFQEGPAQTAELAEGIAAEYDAQGRLTGLEILDITHRFGSREPLRQIILEGIGATGKP